jgi:hypothetical protein
MIDKFKLRQGLENTLIKYVRAFEKKQGVTFLGWDAQYILFHLCNFNYNGKTIAFSMDDIIIDIDKECSKGLIFDWHTQTSGGVIELYLSYEYYIEHNK